MNNSEINILLSRIMSLEKKVEELTNKDNGIVEKNMDHIKITELENNNANLRDRLSKLEKEFGDYKNMYNIENFSKFTNMYISKTDFEDRIKQVTDKIIVDNKNMYKDIKSNIDHYAMDYLDKLLKHREDFALRNEVSTGYVSKEDYNKDIYDVHKNMTDIFRGMKEINSHLQYKLGRTDVDYELNKFKQGWIAEFDTEDFVSSFDLAKALDKYQHKLDSSIMFNDLNQKMTSLIEKIENVPTREELMDVIKAHNISEDKSDLYYTAYAIDTKLNNLISYDQVINLINNVYDKHTIDTKIDRLVSRTDYIDTINELNSSIKKIITKISEDTGIDNKLLPYSDRLTKLEIRQEDSLENIKVTIKHAYDDIMSLINDTIKSKVKTIDDSILIELGTLRDLVTRLDNKSYDYMSRTDLEEWVKHNKEG